MFGKPITLFKLFGFAVRLDFSWFIVAILVVWSLAVGLFPALVQGLAASTYWAMGVAGALGLFASVILHEFGHSIVARRYGLPIKGITLFIFGGVAELEQEPQNAKTEFLVAIAGPIVSILITLVCFGLTSAGQAAGWPVAVTAVFSYLAIINTALVLFNSIPAFPLDGGRVLRSALWHWKGNLRWATRITSQLGSGFGLLLIGFGIISIVFGNFIGGVWWFLIGLFLRNAASMSYQQLLVRQALEGEPVHRFMATQLVTVPPTIPIQALIDEYIYRHYYKLFPVVDDDQLVGCVTVDRVKQLSQEEWNTQTVESVMDQCSSKNTIRSDADAMDALTKMNRTGVSRLMVVDDGRLIGIIALKDLMRFFSLKLELEEETGDGSSEASHTESRTDRTRRQVSAER